MQGVPWVIPNLHGVGERQVRRNYLRLRILLLPESIEVVGQRRSNCGLTTGLGLGRTPYPKEGPLPSGAPGEIQCNDCCHWCSDWPDKRRHTPRQPCAERGACG